MKRLFLLGIIPVAACVVQTESVVGPKGDKGDSATVGDAESLDGLDSGRFMRSDVDTGTTGSIFAKGGARFEGERSDLESATVSISQSNPTFGGNSSVVNIDVESDAGSWYFLRARNIDTPLDGGPPIATDKFVVASDGTIVTWSNIGVGTQAPEAPVHIVSPDKYLGMIVDTSSPSGGAVSFRKSGTPVAAVGPSGAIEGNASSNLGLASEQDVNIYTNGTPVPKVTVSSNGGVGIGTTTPVASLDVAGTARLTRYSSPPTECNDTQDGTIAMTSKHTLCICNGAIWVKSADGMSACAW